MKDRILKLKRKIYVTYKKAEIEIRSINAQIHPSPIFILGNQKSGTSAISALLGASTGLSVSIDLTKEWVYRRKGYLLVKEKQWSFPQFVQRNKLDFSRDIVKEANLTIFYDELVKSFPNSRFVFVVRDPRSNIRSILNRVKVPGHLKSLRNWEDRPYIPLGWKKVIYGSWLGLNGDNYIAMLAQRWNMMADIYLQNSGNMILSRYEDFLDDKVGHISDIAYKLNLNPRFDISEKIDLQFQPKGNNEQSFLSFFGSKNLNRINNICANNMKYFNYNL